MIILNCIWNILLKDPVVNISLEYFLEIRQILNYRERYINEGDMGRELCSIPTGWDRC
jgi:ethanolamine ammonia-lyase small subunit